MNVSSDNLKKFTPAVVYTLYDGYYIYSKYENTENATSEYEYGLKPYIHYSCRYIKDQGMNKTDCIINYTLDNSITIYGTVNGTYISPMSGFLINPSSIDDETKNKIANKQENLITQITLDGNVTISQENLTETLITLDNNNNPFTGTYQYTYYNNQKVYKEVQAGQPDRYFRYSNYKKTYVTATDVETLKYASATIGNNRSAIEYYIDAYKFSTWVNDNIGDLTMNMAVDKNGNKIEFTSDNTANAKIFSFNKDNNPENSESTFNSNRVATIRYSIESSLIAAIANYNQYVNVNYEYRLPVLTATDWGKISNEVCMITFLQGLPIKSKIFNDYCIIANNKNKEFVSKSAIMILGDDGNYHKPNCKDIVDGYVTTQATKIQIQGAYTNLGIARQKVKVSDENIYYFFPHKKIDGTAYLNCYDCIVNIADVYDLDELIDGQVKDLDEGGVAIGIKYDASKLKEVRSAYFTALAREKYVLYKSLNY